MDFEKALKILKEDNRPIYRTGWNGKGMYIGLQRPDENSANTLPYLYISTADGKRVPWVASHSDILGEDWEIAPQATSTS